MATLRDRSTRRDRFHQKAKQDGFVARAVYKLEEIDAKHDLFKPGDRVLDLGCSPGSWLQYARSRVGETGVLVGLDRGPLRNPPVGARLLVGDVMTIEINDLLGELPAPGDRPVGRSSAEGARAFDVVLSDMAPDTSGIRSLDQDRSEALFERALEIAKVVLAPGGNFVGKLFQGAGFKKLTEDVRLAFAKMKTVKPESSRQISIEQYVVGVGFRGDKA